MPLRDISGIITADQLNNGVITDAVGKISSWF